jgi:hypothetical protein
MKKNKKFIHIAKIVVFFAMLIVLIRKVSEGAEYKIFPIKNRPDGWNGITWGSPQDTLGKDRIFISETTEDGALFIKPGETSVFGNAQINRINYYFKKNQLTRIDLYCNESEQKELLDNAVKIFGNPQNVGVDDNEFLWFDDVVAIHIQFKSKAAKYPVLRFLIIPANENYSLFHPKPIKNINNIEGFGGLKFGDSPELLGEQKVLIAINKSKNAEKYKKINDMALYENFEIKDVLYCFSDSKLFMIEISFVDSVNAEQLKEYMMEQFGIPEISRTYGKEVEYQWNGGEITIVLKCYQNNVGAKLVYGLWDVIYGR